MNSGRFITLEGGEGVGKTTCLEAVAERIRAWGREVVVTREPGGTQLGEGLRALLLHGEHVCVEAELLMMFAARVQHVREVIWPALARGCWVVSDRFTDSSYAYQGGGRGVPAANLRFLEQFLPGALQPDLTLLLDAPVEVGRARALARGGTDRFESEALVFQERVRDAYLERAAAFPERIVVIDASGPAGAVRCHLLAALEQRCASWL
ncbi:dTMP kinase [Methylotetracoccus oryzae]|uniref:dTMP kinase n=1 Tax=Methylotetracoccus oryzae TaxID=1919059 RepID=UPI001118EA14